MSETQEGLAPGEAMQLTLHDAGSPGKSVRSTEYLLAIICGPHRKESLQAENRRSSGVLRGWARMNFGQTDKKHSRRNSFSN
jgi:hypothetical protein